MKLVWKIIIPSGFFIIVTATILTLILTLEISWWWFLGWIILCVLIALIIAVIFLVIYIRRPKPPKEEETGTAIEYVKQELRNNPDYGYEYIIKKKAPMAIGEPGRERTKIIITEGEDYWHDNRIFTGQKLADIKNPAILINPTNQEIVETINRLAENPEFIETYEDIPYISEEGIQKMKRIRKKISRAEQEKQEEIKEAQEAEAG